MNRPMTYASACAVAVFLAATAALAAAAPLVRTAHSTALKATILVDRRGHTLYDLSVERKGRFICTTKSCLSFWHPLVVAKGTRPTGAVALGTVLRPDGRIQVTYRGAPLYTFVEDTKAGDTRGEGFKDVGVWHAATTSLTTAASSTRPGGGGYTYP